MNRNSINDETDRHLILDFLRQHPGKSFEEVEIKTHTGIAKSRVRNLVRGVPGIDESKLNAGVVCWSLPNDSDSTFQDVQLTTDN